MFTLVIPFHRDFQRLEITLKNIRAGIHIHQVKEVLLCHNGPRLSEADWQKVKEWNQGMGRLLHTDAQGLGAGYKLGIENATQEYVVLSHSDLPFGWSDIENFIIEGPRDMVLGSKAHPDSKAKDRPFRRLLATGTFKTLRKLILGPYTPGDSQGTVIIKTSLAKDLVKACEFDNYLISCELVTIHQARGGNYHEVPVILMEEIGPSNVRLVQDGSRMLLGLFKLAFRYRFKIYQANQSRLQRL